MGYSHLIENPHHKKRISIIKTIVIKESSILYGARRISTPALASDLASFLFKGADREMLVVAALDIKCSPLSLEVAAIGNIDCCLVSPREVFKSAIISNAAFIMVFHNHVSGDPAPSREDINITKRLIGSGELLNIPLLDHIIMGEYSTYFSFRESGAVQFSDKQQNYMN